MERGIRKERKSRRRRPAKWRHGMPSLERISRVAFTIITLCLAAAVANENITLGISPVVQQGPELHTYFNAGYPIKLTCRARGAEPIRYRWFKDGKEIEGRIQYGPTRGVLYFKETTKTTEGFYHCEAHNGYGTGLSNITYLQHAYLERVAGKQRDQVERKNASVGTKLSLACQQMKYAPSRTCFWETKKQLAKSDEGFDIDEDAPMKCSDFFHGNRVKLSDRISMDENCNLAIAHILAEDDTIYKCYTVNPQISRRVGSGCTKVIVQQNPHEQNLVPSRMFTSESPVVVFEGEDIKLKGFFSGRPTPSVTWWKEDGELPVNRTLTRHKLSHQLHIRPARLEDAGYYVCQGVNEAGRSKDVRIRVDVHAKPTLIEGPASRNVSLGSTVRFTCSARGKPEPSVGWLRNNETLTDDNRPSHWWVSANGSTLTIRKATYEDRATVHCNVSNVHATLLHAAYLNVVDPDRLPEVNIRGSTAATGRNGSEVSEQQPSLLWVVFLFIAIVLAAILCLVAWIAYKKRHHQSYARAGSVRSAHVEAEMQQWPQEGATVQGFTSHDPN